MRILPIIIAMNESSFDEVARYIVANGVATHGHPRALVGALLYGNACSVYYDHSGSLAYGELIDRLESNLQWGVMPEISDLWADWHSAMGVSYLDEWQGVVSEAIEGLKLLKKLVKNGSALTESEAFSAIGACGKAGGSGIATSLAVLYLASRHAQDPLQALLAAAYNDQIDSDTVASMAGGLLGLLHGPDWLEVFGESIQDFAYLRNFSVQLVDRDRLSVSQGLFDDFEFNWAKERDIKRDVFGSKIGDTIELALGRTAKVVSIVHAPAKGDKVRGRIAKVIASDGQSLYFKDVQPKTQMVDAEPISGDTKGHRVAVRFPVKDVKETSNFYGRLLGLPVSKETGTGLLVNGCLAFSKVENSVFAPGDQIIFIETSEVDSIRERLSRAELPILGNFHRSGAKGFRTVDPDGYYVEVLEFRSSRKGE